MKAESGLRGRIRQELRRVFGQYRAKIVGQPANAMTGPGRSDLYVLVLGVHVDLEIKTATGKPTAIQQENIRATRAAGGYAWLVRSPGQAVNAVWWAVDRKPMSGDFDFLFDEAAEGQRDVRAFLEPEIQAAVERNGQTPAGDGAAIEPAADYTLAAVVTRLDQIDKTLHTLINKVGALLLDASTPVEAASSASVADLLAESEPEPTTPAPPTTKRVRKPRQ